MPEEISIEFSQDVAQGDELLENSDAFLSQVCEPLEMCTFNPNFPELDQLKVSE